jgi:hypothetical protein
MHRQSSLKQHSVVGGVPAELMAQHTDRCSPHSCHRLAPFMFVFIVLLALHYKVN